MESGKCSLYDLIKAGRKYSQPEILCFLKNITRALLIAKMRLRIAHRDLKPKNIILGEDFCTFKIADFGESVFVESSDDIIKAFVVGTPDYMAPEMYWEYLILKVDSN